MTPENYTNATVSEDGELLKGVGVRIILLQVVKVSLSLPLSAGLHIEQAQKEN